MTTPSAPTRCARTDELVGPLLDELDLERDAVVVVAPSVASSPRLTVLGVRAAEYPPGLLVSGTTRQDGYVDAGRRHADDRRRSPAPRSTRVRIEGRQVEVGATGGSAADRRERLVEADEVARFRDRMLTPVAATYITGVCVLALGARRSCCARRSRSRALGFAALALLGVTPMTYLARLLPVPRVGPLAVRRVRRGRRPRPRRALRSLLRGSWLRPAGRRLRASSCW